MKKSSIIIIFISCLVLFLSSFFYGYYFTGNKISKKPDFNNTESNGINGNEVEIIKEEIRVSPNTSFKLETYYAKCGHTIKDEIEFDNGVINMSKNDFNNYIKEKYQDLKLVSFSFDEVVLRKIKNTLCQNHYIISEFEGNIAVYKIDQMGEKVLYKKLEDYPLSLLKEIDQEKLKKGIIVDSEEELSDVLENFIS